ncbi:CBS domain-containing protein [Flammeovirgaceae bacterium SG7u.111]|nr:CBS domain-containing protein [Flammeovirgaceae bacterium SG7u.132]WPO37195.1 CBS domain-containing protein [Flammeovirgaceae bacterium SG7u.111]
MKLNVPISKVMMTQIFTVEPKDKLSVIKETFDLYHFRHLPVINQGRMVGIISQSDFLRVTYGANLKPEEDQQVNEEIYGSITAEEIMTHVVRTLTSKHTVLDAALLFEKNQFHCLPIVDKGKLVGMVTPIDLVRHLKNRILLNKDMEDAGSRLPKSELSIGNSLSNL